MSRRNKKLRRRLRMTLKSGHEARHRLQSGRTGKVHSVKMRSPRKERPDGVVEILIPPIGLEHKPEPVAQEKFNEPIPVIRVRNKPQIIAPSPSHHIEPCTSVDHVIFAYGLCLKAISHLSEAKVLSPKATGLLCNLITAIEIYEVK